MVIKPLNPRHVSLFSLCHSFISFFFFRLISIILSSFLYQSLSVSVWIRLHLYLILSPSMPSLSKNRWHLDNSLLPLHSFYLIYASNRTGLPTQRLSRIPDLLVWDPIIISCLVSWWMEHDAIHGLRGSKGKQSWLAASKQGHSVRGHIKAGYADIQKCCQAFILAPPNIGWAPTFFAQWVWLIDKHLSPFNF